jgi:hypothetical protein
MEPTLDPTQKSNLITYFSVGDVTYNHSKSK